MNPDLRPTGHTRITLCGHPAITMGVVNLVALLGSAEYLLVQTSGQRAENTHSGKGHNSFVSSRTPSKCMEKGAKIGSSQVLGSELRLCSSAGLPTGSFAVEEGGAYEVVKERYATCEKMCTGISSSKTHSGGNATKVRRGCRGGRRHRRHHKVLKCELPQQAAGWDAFPTQGEGGTTISMKGKEFVPVRDTSQCRASSSTSHTRAAETGQHQVGNVTSRMKHSPAAARPSVKGAKGRHLQRYAKATEHVETCSGFCSPQLRHSCASATQQEQQLSLTPLNTAVSPKLGIAQNVRHRKRERGFFNDNVTGSVTPGAQTLGEDSLNSRGSSHAASRGFGSGSDSTGGGCVTEGHPIAFPHRLSEVWGKWSLEDAHVVSKVMCDGTGTSADMPGSWLGFELNEHSPCAEERYDVESLDPGCGHDRHRSGRISGLQGIHTPMQMASPVLGFITVENTLSREFSIDSSTIASSECSLYH
ncbi:hypothetical protein TRVL_06230 [Trypanosoma vivax]|uniref:Uncharacterized protein n=1 Tax=Trypanosoma vivax (strain Y486) TaxID=1055687 RepID=G0TR70_TRYVY|nr:hypothetical protein TRVL_06230 [Trypanosoma vivax]CCC46434.1 conserved hypothetical protein [Trypanosoma vivax Y486]